MISFPKLAAMMQILTLKKSSPFAVLQI